jgi:hypothetical protein
VAVFTVAKVKQSPVKRVCTVHSQTHAHLAVCVHGRFRECHAGGKEEILVVCRDAAAEIPIFEELVQQRFARDGADRTS